MRIDQKTLQMQITRLRRLINDVPDDLSGVPEQAHYILKTAPKLLSDAEATLRNNHAPSVLNQLYEVLSKAETILRWAAGSATGKKMAETIRRGENPNHSDHPQRRLNQRITQFLATQVNGEQYTELIKEFCGDDAVDGTTVYMDPKGESEVFAQWLLQDKVLPGKSKRLIEIFAEQSIDELPSDEQLLLKSQLRDRPSIYQVAKFQKDRKTGKKKDTYLVQDLLSPEEVIRIRDHSTSKTLQLKEIFIGRAIPPENGRFFGLLRVLQKNPRK